MIGCEARQKLYNRCNRCDHFRDATKMVVPRSELIAIVKRRPATEKQRMVSAIHEQINRALADCHMNTGKPAKRIYLGRTQMERLMRWAYENSRITDDGRAKREGNQRPEVMGLPVYEVNEDDHCVAA